MKKFRSLRFTVLFLIALFALNTFIMYAFFDINVLKLGQASSDPETSGQSDGIGAIAGSGYNPKWKSSSDADNSSETEKEGNRNPFSPGLWETTETSASDGSPAAGNNSGLQDAEAAAPDQQDAAEVFLTATQVADLEKLALGDKLEALAIISKIEPGERDRIFKMALDGVTFVELESIEEELQDILTADEIERLKEILEDKPQ